MRLTRFIAHLKHATIEDAFIALFELDTFKIMGAKGIYPHAGSSTSLDIEEVNPHTIRLRAANRAVHFWTYELQFSTTTSETLLHVYFDATEVATYDYPDPTYLDRDIAVLAEMFNGYIERPHRR